VSHRMQRPLAFSVPKCEGQRNEDWYQFSSKGVCALSDGASISFDSASWSKILARRYAQYPHLTLEWVSTAIFEFSKLHDRDSLPWMKQASFDKGSFASLLGVTIIDQGRLIQVMSIGDSLAVLCDGDEIKTTYPYIFSEQFSQSPQLLSTNYHENEFLETINLAYDLHADWSSSGLTRPGLLCMTDALGQWLLTKRDDGTSPISLLRAITTSREFNRLIENERKSGRLKRDDTTLLAFWW
jgi:hypothetical protein